MLECYFLSEKESNQRNLSEIETHAHDVPALKPDFSPGKSGAEIERSS